MLPSKMESIRAKHGDTGELLIRIHHELMKEYGWIPVDEFRQIPMTTLMNLWEMVIEDRKRKDRSFRRRK